MRTSGILFHISSLPSPYGIGTLGKEAYAFVDFLKNAGQSYWQVLPIGPTSYGDSPYQTFSAFAGNPYYIDLDILKEEGLLEDSDLHSLEYQYSDKVNYEWVYNTRFKVLRKAFDKYTKVCNETDVIKFNTFTKENDDWLQDYALFMAIKNEQVEGNWHGWEEKYAKRDKQALECFLKTHNDDVMYWKWIQYKFFEQWLSLKKYANSKDIKIIGDMPIYVAYDSADVWADPYHWQLDEDLLPIVVAGCPPDYFAKTGQLWGNPIYDYDKMGKEGFPWWIKRIKKSFEIFDVVRIDHFRGFEAYYAIPYSHKTAEFGTWITGPGYPLFKAIKDVLGDLDIIAEDLGFLTEGVYKLLKQCGYPGMKILQFGFNPDSDSDHLPHNYTHNSICYTGTHDNMTLKDWLSRLSDRERKFVFEYANINNLNEAVDKLIKCCLSSVSERCIIPLRDYLELGSEGRYNIPSTLGGNWEWRIEKKQFTYELCDRILRNTKIYKR